MLIFLNSYFIRAYNYINRFKNKSFIIIYKRINSRIIKEKYDMRIFVNDYLHNLITSVIMMV